MLAALNNTSAVQSAGKPAAGKRATKRQGFGWSRLSIAICIALTSLAATPASAQINRPKPPKSPAQSTPTPKKSAPTLSTRLENSGKIRTDAPKSRIRTDMAPPRASTRASTRAQTQAAARTEERAAARAQAAAQQQVYRELPEQNLRRLDLSLVALREQSKAIALNPNASRSLGPDDADGHETLEGIANEAVLSQIIKATYTEALRKGWRQSDRFHIFPIEKVVEQSVQQAPMQFNEDSVRIAVFGLKKNNRLARAVILTADFQSNDPGEVRRLFAREEIVKLVTDYHPQLEYNRYAEELVRRFLDDNSRVSEYLPVTGAARSWVMNCEITISGKFCINARVFDAIDTSTEIFYDALVGASTDDPRVKQIKADRISWPIDESYISRGFKTVRGSKPHYGLDLATPRGTIIKAVQKGKIWKMQRMSGWGNMVVIEHTLPGDKKYYSLYAHLSQYIRGLRVGDEVKQGQIIAKSGNSGRSTGPHLHLEIRYEVEGRDPLEMPNRRNQPLDPLRVLDVFNVFVDAGTK